jgi:hypothetical protein
MGEASARQKMNVLLKRENKKKQSTKRTKAKEDSDEDSDDEAGVTCTKTKPLGVAKKKSKDGINIIQQLSTILQTNYTDYKTCNQ